MRTVVVTGTSTGIGRATVASLVARGVHTVATVRNAADAESLRAEFGESVTPLVADVVDAPSLAAAAAVTRERLQGATLHGLVANAGIAHAGPVLEQTMEDVRRVMEVNFFGALETVRAFAPLLGTEPGRAGAPGRIVLVGSIAGWRALPFMSAYAASKHALKAVAEALRGELRPFGIEVALVEPGPVATPIWGKDISDEAAARYAAGPYREPVARFRAMAANEAAGALPVETAGEVICDALTATPPPTRRVLMRNKFFKFTLPTLLPDRFVDGVIAKQFGLDRG